MIAIRRLIVPLLLVAPAFELTVRFDDLIRFGVPFTSGATNVMDLQVTDSLGRHARAGAAYQKYRINSLGFRGPEVSLAAAGRGPLIVVSGASESFGLYESQGREWPRQFADSLALRCTATPPIVLNAAFAGMSLPTVLQDIERRIVPLQPQLIVYYPQPSQYLFERVPRPAVPATGGAEPLSPFRLRALPRLREDFKRVLPAAVIDYNRRRGTMQQRDAGEEVFPRLPVERLDTLELHLRSLVGTVRRSGVELALVIPRHRLTDTTSVEDRRWLRAWENILPKAPGAMILEFSNAAEERIRRVAADSSVRLIDPAFAEGTERSRLFADPQHFTDRGAAVLAAGASRVAAELLECGPGTSVGASAPTPLR